MDENERGKFRGPAREGGIITVTCAFDIPPATQARLNKTLHLYLSEDMEVDYVRSDDILSGCELRSDGHKISWSMKDYLDTIEERFNSALYEEAQERT
jgi:F-type H+-transporting ATPase subunit b